MHLVVLVVVARTIRGNGKPQGVSSVQGGEAVLGVVTPPGSPASTEDKGTERLVAPVRNDAGEHEGRLGCWQYRSPPAPFRGSAQLIFFGQFCYWSTGVPSAPGQACDSADSRQAARVFPCLVVRTLAESHLGHFRPSPSPSPRSPSTARWKRLRRPR
ncbi:hypothetical protein B0H63DRAFT_458246 [Podospora didyma]|uniref:Uncharacterized protein n=1 Tax=Podospora didyma TaxID=330526 RepID=A0AAE0P4V3_9PEZI|nr:hypothetical protein B0H63DRAFT_458246 [Podospora didyma]